MTRPTIHRRTRLGGDRGSVALEAVLVIPVVMLLLLAIVQFVLWAHAAQATQLAAAEGDRSARALGAGSAAGVSQAQSVLRSGSDVVSSSVSVVVLSGDLIQVTVTGRAVSIFPGLSLPVSATQLGPVQEFRGLE